MKEWYPHVTSVINVTSVITNTDLVKIIYSGWNKPCPVIIFSERDVRVWRNALAQLIMHYAHIKIKQIIMWLPQSSIAGVLCLYKARSFIMWLCRSRPSDGELIVVSRLCHTLGNLSPDKVYFKGCKLGRSYIKRISRPKASEYSGNMHNVWYLNRHA